MHRRRDHFTKLQNSVLRMPMSLKVLGRTDDYLDAVMKVLANYEAQHPRAQIEGRRQNSVSIRIRIVDPDFANVSRTDRHDAVWRVLDELPEEILSQLTSILLFTPEEKKMSFASVEFDDPIPSKL
jgi:stress-induced morphogen